ncbi:MAG: hypothetical protein R6U10_07910 [Thermoplasmatota archaeon]
MNRKYIALALVGLIGCAGLVSAGVIGVELADGYGMMGAGSGSDDAEHGAENGGGAGPGRWLQERIRDRVHDRVRDRIMERHRHQMEYAERMAENYLNLTRLDGVLSYDNETGTYMIDCTVLYLGDEHFLASPARSDYDQDGSYEPVQDELQGLVGIDVAANGLLVNDTLYVSHVNGIWLRAPRAANVVELEGVLEEVNGSFFVDGVRLLFPMRSMSRSDIDGDGMLEPLRSELDGVVGTAVVVDGASRDNGLLVAHVNGIWTR